MSEYLVRDTLTGTILARHRHREAALFSARVFRRMLRLPAGSLRVQVMEEQAAVPEEGQLVGQEKP